METSTQVYKNLKPEYQARVDEVQAKLYKLVRLWDWDSEADLPKTTMKNALFTVEMYFAGGPGISEQTITRNVLAEGLEEAIAALEDEFGIIDDYKVYQTGTE